MNETVANLKKAYESVLNRLGRMTTENFDYILNGLKGDISRIESLKSLLSEEDKVLADGECEELVKQIRENFDNRLKEWKSDLEETKSALEKTLNKKKAAQYQR
jgi:BMFP domain-containing protein YqiC